MALPDSVVVPIEFTAGGRVALWLGEAGVRLTWHFRGLPLTEEKGQQVEPEGSSGEPLVH